MSFTPQELDQVSEVVRNVLLDVLGNLPDQEPVNPVGEEMGFAGYALEYFEVRRIGASKFGPLVQRSFATMPTRLLYENSSNTEAEVALLNFNRDLIEAEPHWFVGNMIGGANLRECRDLDGKLIPGTMVRPLINKNVNHQRSIGREQAEREAKKFAMQRIHTAHLRDLDADNAETNF